MVNPAGRGQYVCFAICAPGLEPIVARELAALGERPRPEPGGVTWTGDARSVMRANLWLRTASRILVRVARFHARTFPELERHARRVPWDRYVSDGARPVEFRVTAHKSRLIHSRAIAERLYRVIGISPLPADRSSPGDTQQFVVRVVRDQFEISADSSGELLHVRGYRQAVAKAPLRETLAAALLLAARWESEEALMDPFCGSGTIPIEAALMARHVAPGLRREFAFAHWPGSDATLWRRLVHEARARALARVRAPIVGCDRDVGAIATARANAERAGVGDDVSFAVRPVSAVEPPPGRGLVATNPPYGVRLSGSADLRNLYARFGSVVHERCGGWRAAFYAGSDRLARHTGLDPTVMYRTSNGGIRVAAWRSQTLPEARGT